MSRILIVAITVLAAQNAAKPPKQSYDSKTDQTTYSSGDIRTGGLTGMSAEFTFAGKTPKAPEFINLGIGALRVKKGDNPTDESLLQWQSVNAAQIKVGSDEIDIDAKPGWHVSQNGMVKLIYGHALEEFADIHLSLTQFHEIATADGITVTLGKKDGSSFTKVEERTIKQAQIKSLKALDLAVPAASAAAQLR